MSKATDLIEDLDKMSEKAFKAEIVIMSADGKGKLELTNGDWHGIKEIAFGAEPGKFKKGQTVDVDIVGGRKAPRVGSIK